jgi:uracil-DNA glycosylase
MQRQTSLSPAEMLDALAWQVELGADEAIGEAPVDRFDLAEPPPARARPRGPAPSAVAPTPVPQEATGTAALAAACTDLASLRAAMAGFEGCALRLGARNLVFADGNPAARLMVIGEAPGRDEDIAGLPFVGRSGQLLDRMLAAIGLSRRADDPASAVYITNTLPWRPPQNREPAADEVAMLLPFLHRHIELKAPEVLLLVGAASVRTLMQTGEGITRTRGRWMDCRGIPTIATFHPAALLRDGLKKREVWSDLLSLKVRLDGR